LVFHWVYDFWTEENVSLDTYLLLILGGVVGRQEPNLEFCVLKNLSMPAGIVGLGVGCPEPRAHFLN